MPYIPDIELYDSFLVEQFNKSCNLIPDWKDSIHEDWLYEPLAAVHTRRKDIFTTQDILISFSSIFPVAYVEYLLYHRTGNKKRLRAVLPLLDERFTRIESYCLPLSTDEKLITAINCLYMGAMAKIILNPVLEFEYTKKWYYYKNNLKDWPDKYNHFAMLAEIAPSDTMPTSDSFLAVKALEKYKRFLEARNMALRIVYDNEPYPEMVPLVIESILGIHLSTAKKTLDFVAPDVEKFSVYGLQLGSNTISISYDKGSLSISTDKTIYLTANAQGKELKRMPLLSTYACTIKL